MDVNNSASSKRKSNSFVIEIVIVALLTLLIFATLNYFNIFPVSKFIPFLSFLPSQQSTLRSNQSPFSKSEKVLTVKSLISETKPKIVNNTTEKELNSFTKSITIPPGEMQIKVTMIFKPSTPSAQNVSSGMRIGNGLKSNNPKVRWLSLFYHNPTKSWVLSFRSEGKTQNLPLLKNDGGIVGNFTFTMNSNGNSVTILLPNGEEKELKLNNSFYASDRKMHVSFFAPSHSELEVSALKLLY